MKTIKSAVIGVGHLGQHHARVYSELENTELVCVVDADPSRSREIGERLEVPFLTDYQELPKEVEAVSVATPTKYHYEIAKYLLEKGIHVLVEKPMTNTTEEARELVELANEKGCKLQVGHIERFNPAMMGVREHIDDPIFIEANRVSPFTFRSIDVSVIHDMMIHDLDIVLELANSEVIEVEAIGSKILSPSEDVANVRLKFASGCIADITASRIAHKSLREIRVFQKNTYINLDYISKTAWIMELKPDYSPEKLKDIDPRQDPSLLHELVFDRFFNRKELVLDGKEPLKNELGAFVKAIREDGKVEVPGEDGLRAMEMIDTIYSSLEANQWRLKK